MKDVHAAVVRELKKHRDARYREGAERYFKEGIVLHGVRLPVVRRIASEFYRAVERASKPQIFRLCAELLRSGYSEEKTIAFAWAYRRRQEYGPDDFRTFESWLRKYVATWGDCDDLCCHTLGAFVYRFPGCLPDVLGWTGSKSRWLRRGAAVVMIHSLRKGEHLDTALQIADALLRDDDYLVQNGYGWMLKDASLVFPEPVYEYVLGRRREMPRRALRYALERYAPEARRRAML